MKPITISLSPNTESDDIFLALKTFFQPWKWKTGNELDLVKKWFHLYFKTTQVLLYNSGRSAEFELLKAFNIGKGDEVIIQAFTCVAVPNSVLWNGATPVYVDIDSSFNISIKDLEKKITKNTKAIIVQHTFGIPAEIDAIADIAKKHHLIIIEDCAHSLGGSYKGKALGSWGDAAFFSFGRDKVISSVFGGAAIVQEKHTKIFEKLEKNYLEVPSPTLGWIGQQLFHPIAFSLILPLYALGVGKGLLFIFQKFHWLSFPVYPSEKKGKNPGIFPQRYPNGLACLLWNQLKKLEKYNQNRRDIARIYTKKFKSLTTQSVPNEGDPVYLRFSLCLPEPDKLRDTCKQHSILLGNWYRTAVDPKGTDFNAIGYLSGSCPRAELISSQVINLPTRIGIEDAQKIIDMIE